jgi:hypothetical protein
MSLDFTTPRAGRGFSFLAGVFIDDHAGIQSWLAETFESQSPSHARSASIATIRRTRASETHPTG